MLSSSFTAVDSRHAGVLLFLPGGGVTGGACAVPRSLSSLTAEKQLPVTEGRMH